MESEQNIIKYIRSQQTEELKLIQKNIADMQARINICDDVINSVPNHEQSVLKGTSMAYHKSVHEASISREDRKIYQSCIDDFNGQIAAISLSYSDQVTEFIKNVNYMAVAKQGVLKQRVSGRSMDLHEKAFNAQLEQMNKLLVDIPADLVKPFVADLLYIENYELKGVA